MKKAKIALTCIVIFSIAGGALAFKANRLPRNLYTLLAGNKPTSITVGGIVYTTTIPNCTLTALRTTNVGLVSTGWFTTTDPLITTTFI